MHNFHGHYKILTIKEREKLSLACDIIWSNLSTTKEDIKLLFMEAPDLKYNSSAQAQKDNLIRFNLPSIKQDFKNLPLTQSIIYLMAHELTHIWQYKHYNPKETPKLLDQSEITARVVSLHAFKLLFPSINFNYKETYKSIKFNLPKQTGFKFYGYEELWLNS